MLEDCNTTHGVRYLRRDQWHGTAHLQERLRQRVLAVLPVLPVLEDELEQVLLQPVGGGVATVPVKYASVDQWLSRRRTGLDLCAIAKLSQHDHFLPFSEPNGDKSPLHLMQIRHNHEAFAPIAAHHGVYLRLHRNTWYSRARQCQWHGPPLQQHRRTA